MQAILGLALFSVLLATGATLECEECSGQGERCSGRRITCPHNSDTCQAVVTETGGVIDITKSCSTRAVCAELKAQEGKTRQTLSFIKRVECSKASPSSGSLLLVLTGFLLMKAFL
ncbi:phospholipase A2 inhibitor NAI-like [Hemicordylus capensis]|uniref:phospholipase A2 inhibitor NAI-like n=1 Tax=Hemicordylus capensis TaxID=884348 RepID=UPI0023040F70|nr:phospholipase A2 inhibitor NAI-like [Hemicordylus capensis]